MLKGIDISKHQGTPNFFEISEAGFRFVISKATEGTSYLDPRFKANFQSTVLNGLMPGAYHFCRPSSDGSVQDAENEANDFCDALDSVGYNDQPSLPPAIDFEEYSDNRPKENVPWLSRFVRTVRDRMDREPMIYTGRNVWRYEAGNTDAFTDLPLWLVRYHKNARLHEGHSVLEFTAAQGAMPWKRWTFRQWSGGGKFNFHGPVPGVKGACDVNLFNGTEADLAKLCEVPARIQPMCEVGERPELIADWLEAKAKELRGA